jgi:hypothetical protein
MHLLLTPQRDGLADRGHVSIQERHRARDCIRACGPLFTVRRAAVGFGHLASFTNVAAFDNAPEDVSRFLKILSVKAQL